MRAQAGKAKAVPEAAVFPASHLSHRSMEIESQKKKRWVGAVGSHWATSGE